MAIFHRQRIYCFISFNQDAKNIDWNSTLNPIREPTPTSPEVPNWPWLLFLWCFWQPFLSEMHKPGHKHSLASLSLPQRCFWIPLSGHIFKPLQDIRFDPASQLYLIAVYLLSAWGETTLLKTVKHCTHRAWLIPFTKLLFWIVQLSTLMKKASIRDRAWKPEVFSALGKSHSVKGTVLKPSPFHWKIGFPICRWWLYLWRHTQLKSVQLWHYAIWHMQTSLYKISMYLSTSF